MKLNTIPGIGPKTLEKLTTLKILTVEDLLLTVPKSYDERKLSTTIQETPAYYKATVESAPKIFSIRRNLKRLTCKISVLGTSVQMALFNQTHWFHQLNVGTEIVVYGSVKPSMTAQKVFLAANFKPGIIPNYRLKKLSDTRFQGFVEKAFERLTIPESLPEVIRHKFQLNSRHDTLFYAHFPRSMQDVEAFFTWQKIAYLTSREIDRSQSNKAPLEAAKPVDHAQLDAWIKQLPFTLTKGQNESVAMLVEDLKAPMPARRLLQGDTGSGKTVVALLSSLLLMEQGFQVAFMAPTEILAEQHHKTFQSLFGGAFKSTVLTGSLDKKVLKNRLSALKAGDIGIVFGTHLLFSPSTHFHKLGQVIIDEQHRFGVNQREALIQKGASADLISLSATPIPRTLALTLYQDMDVTTLKEMPANRQAVKTEVIPLKDAKTLDYMIDMTLEENQQVFIVAPRIEDDDMLLSVERIESYYLSRFKNARIATLHGGQPATEKTQTLHAFQAHEIDILIATSVIEVGIDVKNAGLMLIYHAERFGYAQLHQLRGRLGRHHIPGVCYLLYQGKAPIKERLTVLKTMTDGFEIAQMDLKMRGFGTLFGTDQTGFSALQAWPYEETLALIETIQETLQSTP